MDLVGDILFYAVCILNPIIILSTYNKNRILRLWFKLSIPNYPKYKLMKDKDLGFVNRWIFKDPDDKIILIYFYNAPMIVRYLKVGEIDQSEIKSLFNLSSSLSSVPEMKNTYQESANKDSLDEINYILANYEKWRMENIL